MPRLRLLALGRSGKKLSLRPPPLRTASGPGVRSGISRIGLGSPEADPAPNRHRALATHFCRSVLVLAAMLVPASGSADPTTIAVTIDDLPWVGPVRPNESVGDGVGRIMAALEAHGAPATGFAVCNRVSGEAPVLRRWVGAGLGLGNHSTTHRHLDALSPKEWEEDVAGCRDVLAAIPGASRWFRYPFLQRGRTPERRDAGREALRRLGLDVAPVTIDTSEWALVEPYVTALRAGDEARAAEIAAAYVDHVVTATRHFRAVATARVGRPTAHVLLLHANALAADHLGALLDALTSDGARFVTLDEALRDPIYALPDDYAGPVGLSWLYRIAPGARHAWDWDDGQLQALQRRFGGTPDTDRARIGPDLTVRPAAPRAWVVTHEQPMPANSLLAEMRDGTLVLVDTPFTPEATRDLLDWATARFGRRKMVAINSHFHFDATGGNATLRAAGIPVYGSDATVALLRERTPAMRKAVLDWLGDRPEAAPFRELVPDAPDHVFPLSDGLELKLGDEVVRVIHPGPAHSPDNVVVHIPSLGVLFGGCMLLAGDRVGNRSDADLARWPDAIRRLEGLPATVVVPGHGDRTDRGVLQWTLGLVGGDAAGRGGETPGSD